MRATCTELYTHIDWNCRLIKTWANATPTSKRQLWAIHKTYARILVTGFGIELSEFLALHSEKQSKYVECARNL
jgi:hypothetical protein